MTTTATTIPTFAFSRDELGRQCPDPGTVSAASAALREQGTLIVENAFPPALVHSLGTGFLNRYSGCFTGEDTLDCLSVGNRRKMITVTVQGVFNNRAVYANPLLMPIIRSALGERVILNGYGSVAALPGSQTQHTHRDYTGLFLDEDIDSALPAFALTVIIPLIAIDETVGGTRVWPGSHRLGEQACKALGFADPVMPLGSCLFMDYMLVHAGQANRSERVRPIMYNIYSRPWFRDDANYVKQLPLDIPDAEYARVPEDCKALFSWAKMVGGQPPRIDADARCPCGSGRNYRDCHGKTF